MIDLALAKFAYDRIPPPEYKRPFDNPIFRKRAVVETAIRNGDYDKLLKRIRDNAYRKHDGHNKQLAFMMDRERFSQNRTWQSEYDRLASEPVDPALQPFVNARLESLKTLLIK